jgi:hypothetical protein
MSPQGPYSNPAYNNAAIQQYASLYGVDPSQIQYVNGQYQVGGPSGNTSPAFQPTYQTGQQATGGGVTPSPLNPVNYASNQTSTQLAGLLGGQVVPDTAMGSPPGAGINIPTPNGIQLPNGQTVDAGVIANLLSRGYSPQAAAQQLSIQSGGAIQVTPQQVQQFMGAPSSTASYVQGQGWTGTNAAGTPQPTSTPQTASTTLGAQSSPAQNPYAVNTSPYGSPQQTGMRPLIQQPGGATSAGTNQGYQSPAGTYGTQGSNGVYYQSGGNFNSGGGIAIPGGAMPTGANPQFPNWNLNPGATNPSTLNNPIGNVSSTIGGVTQRALDYGNQFNNQFGSQYTGDISTQNAYMNQADAAYNDLYNTPGYTTAEAGQINQAPALNAAMTTPGQYQSNYLTGQEQSAITGNPNAVSQAFDPSSIMNIPQGTATQLGQNLGQTQAGFNQILDPNQLTYSDQFVQQLQEQAGQQIGAEYGAAQDQLARQAAASGQVNPLALAAGENRLLQGQGISQADAVTNASIAAQQAQLQSRQALAGMQVGAQTTLGQMGQGAAEFTGQLGLGAGEYAGNTAIYQAQTADQLASQRAAQLAANRQSTNLSNQQQQYQQAYNTANAASGYGQTIANARIAGQQAARNYWQGQGQYFGSQGQSAAQDTLSGAQTSLSAMGQASGQAASTSLGRQGQLRLGPITTGL